MQLYNQFLQRFGEPEITSFVELFSDHEFVGDLHREKAAKRAANLCGQFRAKTSNVLLQNALDVVAESSAIDKVHNATEYKRAIAALT
jgi:hypothetical protein